MGDVLVASKPRQKDEGAAAVEFALVSVVLITLLIGIIQFGYTFFEYIQVAHAAREGVRWAALGQPAQVVPRAQAAAPGLNPGNMNITVNTNAATWTATVQVTYPRTQIVPLPGVPLPATITSTAAQRLE
jgi:Flp pilus assembly protein TadG